MNKLLIAIITRVLNGSAAARFWALCTTIFGTLTANGIGITYQPSPTTQPVVLQPDNVKSTFIYLACTIASGVIAAHVKALRVPQTTTVLNG